MGADAVTGRALHIAYVEDDEDIRALTEIALTSLGGFSVTSFASGEAALAGIPPIEPDAILLDVMMPGLDGKQVLARLRDAPALARTPVVFMTAKTLDAELRELMALGAHGVISKPYDPMTLPDEIRALLGSAPAPGPG